jgi:signal transduction histidine kinase/DNA-binding response OmpR family regulator
LTQPPDSIDRRFTPFGAEFTAPEVEAAYRRWSHAETAKFARLIVLAASIAAVLLAANDVLLARTSPLFFAVVAARLVVLALGLDIYLRSGRGSDHRRLDRSLFAWTIAILALDALASASRPAGFLLHVLVAQTTILGAFVIFPLRYPHRLICGFGGAAAYLAALTAVQVPSTAVFLPLIFAMAIATTFGALIAFRLERLRRLEFVNLAEARERNRRLAEEVTARQASEAALREAKQAAEEANRAKSRFLAMVSHEIRTPMNGVLGLLQLVRGTPLEAAQQRHLATAQASASALIGLLDDIVDFVQLEGRSQILVATDFNLRDAVEGAVALLRGRAEEKGLTLAVNIDAPEPLVLRGDATRLRQILLNLLGNAIKFTGDGSVTVNAVAVPLTGRDRVDVTIAVTDTGIGIAPEWQERIFEEFVQVDPGAARRYGGAGLGLAICRRLATLMGGTIALESRLGHGSTFRAQLPFTRGIAADEDAATAAPAGPLDILVVEDDPVSQEVAAGLLRAGGHNVSVVDRGAAALAALASGRFDAILLDLHLPGMDGLTVAAHIRQLADPRRRAMPILAVTADVTADSRERCAKVGIDAMLAKPILRPALEAALKHLRKGQALPAAAAASTEPASGSLLDRDHVLAQLDALGRERLLNLAHLFQETARVALAELSDAATAGQHRRVAELAHRLRTSTGALGFARLRALATQLEAEAATMSLANVRALAAEWDGVRRSSVEALLAVLRENEAQSPTATPSL